MLSQESIQTVTNAIESRDISALRDWCGNLDNKHSRALFAQVTGQPLPCTVKGTLAALDSYCGITPEDRAAIEANKQAELERDKIQRQLAHNAKRIERVIIEGLPATQWADIKIAAGYDRILKHGASYYLVNAQLTGFNLSRIKGIAPELRGYIAAKLALS